MKILWSHRARRDLLEIGRHIARNSPAAARAWVENLRERAKAAVRNPRSGRVVPELARDDLRELIEGHYRIVYRVGRKRIEILTVFEGHRLPPPVTASGDDQT